VNLGDASSRTTATDGRPRDPVAEVIARLEVSARKGERWLTGYAKSKLRQDPIYRTVLPLIPPRMKVLDLGCGVGLLGLLLDARGLENEIHGIEWDAPKTRFAQRLTEQIPSIQLVCGDLWEESWPQCSMVVLLDVLHYFPPDQQRRLLFRIGSHLPEGGRLLLRVMDARSGGVAMLTRLCEWGAVKFGWNQAPGVHWRPLAAIRGDLLEAGFSILPSPGKADHGLGNCLLVCGKPRSADPLPARSPSGLRRSSRSS